MKIMISICYDPIKKNWNMDRLFQIKENAADNISVISVMNLCCCLVYGNKPFDLHPIEKFNPGIENSNVGNSDDLEYDI